MRVSKETKLAFVATILWGILFHGYRMTNFMWNHDVLYGLDNYQIASGMHNGIPYAIFMRIIAGRMGNEPWFRGCLALVFMGLAVCIVCKLFDIKNKCAIILLSGIMIGFPTITCTFSYVHVIDSRVLAIMVSFLVVYCAEKMQGWLAIATSSFLLSVSVGTYQCNISIAMICIIFVIVKKVIHGIDNKTFCKVVGKYILIGICGTVLYGISLWGALRISGIALASVGGMGQDQVGQISVGNLIEAVKKCYQSFGYFFLGRSGELRLYSCLNIICLLLGAGLITLVIVSRKIYKKKLQCLFCVCMALGLPVICYCLYFLSPGLYAYHRLMEYSLAFVYMIFPIGIEYMHRIVAKERLVKGMKAIFTVMAVLIVYVFVLISNAAYHDMQISTMYQMQLVNRVVDRAEQTNGFEDARAIMVTGRIENDYTGNHLEEYGYADGMTGVALGAYVHADYHWAALFKWYWGYDLELLETEEKERILSTEEYKEMGIWPAEDSVKIIDGVIVVRFSEK